MKSPRNGEIISNHEYHHGRDWGPLVSSTRFKSFCEEPAAFRWHLGVKQSAAMDLGTAAHSAVLELEKLDDLVVLPDIPFRSGADKARWRLWLNDFKVDPIAVEKAKIKDDFIALARHTANRAGKEIVSSAQLEIARAIALSVSECEDASLTLSGALKERSYRAYGLRARPDAIQGNLLCDLKTCAQIDRFRFVARDLMYPMSLAFYEIVLGFCEVEIENWSWVVVESSPYRSAPDGIPRHRVQVFVAQEDMRRDAVASLHKEIELYRQCKKADQWPTRELPIALLDV